MRHKIIVGIALFVLGVISGALLPMRSVLAQGKPDESGMWVIQPMDKPGLYAYLVNTHTGEAFTLAGTDKKAVKLAKGD